MNNNKTKKKKKYQFKHMNIRTPESIYQSLVELAENESRSLNSLVNSILKEKIEEKEKLSKSEKYSLTKNSKKSNFSENLQPSSVTPEFVVDFLILNKIPQKDFLEYCSITSSTLSDFLDPASERKTSNYSKRKMFLGIRKFLEEKERADEGGDF